MFPAAGARLKNYSFMNQSTGGVAVGLRLTPRTQQWRHWHIQLHI